MFDKIDELAEDRCGRVALLSSDRTKFESTLRGTLPGLSTN